MNALYGVRNTHQKCTEQTKRNLKAYELFAKKKKKHFSVGFYSVNAEKFKFKNLH